MTEQNKSLSQMDPDDAWRARVIAASLVLNRLLSQRTFDEAKVTMEQCGAGWPEILVNKIRERFEWFDEAKQQARYDEAMKESNDG